MEGLRTNYWRKLDSFEFWDLYHESKKWFFRSTSFGSSTMFSVIYKKIVHDPWLTCSPHILETPLMNFFHVVQFRTSPTLRFGRNDLFIFMQLFLTKSSNGLILKSLSFKFSVLFRESLSLTRRNFLNVSYGFSVIAMATCSYQNLVD